MTAAAWPMLAERGVPSGPDCTVAQGDPGGSTSAPAWRIEQLADAMDERPRGTLRAQGVLASFAGGLRPPVATLIPNAGPPVTPASLRDVDVARLLASPALPLSVERLRDFGNLGIVDRARVTGSVPRVVAEQLAASGDSLPVGDPVMMTMTLVARRDGVSIESPMFVYGEGADAPRESVYAYADGRALQQALAALIVQATPETLQASPALARADLALRAIANFENGPAPASLADQLVYRAAAFSRSDALAVARSLGRIYDWRIDSQLPQLIDEPRERPVAEALLNAAATQKNSDVALLYAVAVADGFGHEVDRWHRGVDGMDIPRWLDGGRALGLHSIADEAQALARAGYLPASFTGAFSESGAGTTFVPVSGRSAATNALTFVAARLQRARDQALEELSRVAPERAAILDPRSSTFLTLLCADSGPEAVAAYLQGRAARPILPTSTELRSDDVLARVFSRTATWEQLTRTGIF